MSNLLRKRKNEGIWSSLKSLFCSQFWKMSQCIVDQLTIMVLFENPSEKQHRNNKHNTSNLKMFQKYSNKASRYFGHWCRYSYSMMNILRHTFFQFLAFLYHYINRGLTAILWLPYLFSVKSLKQYYLVRCVLEISASTSCFTSTSMKMNSITTPNRANLFRVELLLCGRVFGS